MMRAAPWYTLLPLVAGLAGCGPLACLPGFVAGDDGSCMVDTPEECAVGQVRTTAGECVAPYSETDEPVPTPTPDGSATPTATPTAVGTPDTSAPEIIIR